MVEFLYLILSVFGTAGWFLYFRERNRSRDYANDLCQVIYDHPESTDSLRRSLKWDEINERVENHG